MVCLKKTQCDHHSLQGRKSGGVRWHSLFTHSTKHAIFHFSFSFLKVSGIKTSIALGGSYEGHVYQREKKCLCIFFLKTWDRDGGRIKLNRVKEKQINGALLQKLKGFGHEPKPLHSPRPVWVVIRSSGFGYFKTVNATMYDSLALLCSSAKFYLQLGLNMLWFSLGVFYVLTTTVTSWHPAQLNGVKLLIFK